MSMENFQLPSKIAVGAMTFTAACFSSIFCCQQTANFLGRFVYPIPSKDSPELKDNVLFFDLIDMDKYNELSTISKVVRAGAVIFSTVVIGFSVSALVGAATANAINADVKKCVIAYGLIGTIVGLFFGYMREPNAKLYHIFGH